MSRQHKVTFDKVRRSTESWVQPATYEVVVAFVSGYDAACEFGVLAGFREWLILRSRSEITNRVWDAYVLQIAFPKFADPREALTSEETHKHAIDTMFALIDEFDETAIKPGGLNEIIRGYDKWVQELDARDRLVDQALDAVVKKYPDLGHIEEYTASVERQDERLRIEFFREAKGCEPTPFAVVSMVGEKITSITKKPNKE
jgi:hypothetical protein